MPKFEEEKHMIKRKIVFILVFIMNEVMIRFMGERMFMDIKISLIGNWIRVVIVVLVVLSILHYIKEKAVEIEVQHKEAGTINKK